MSDFEAGFINAVKEVFPQAETVGCFFHLSQSLMRHVQKESAVYDRYKVEEEYAIKVCLRLYTVTFFSRLIYFKV